nr:MAG TPA: hypothetical protein [Caudoviricetes sp.]
MLSVLNFFIYRHYSSEIRDCQAKSRISEINSLKSEGGTP